LLLLVVVPVLPVLPVLLVLLALQLVLRLLPQARLVPPPPLFWLFLRLLGLRLDLPRGQLALAFLESVRRVPFLLLPVQ
tara:strand:- start:1112 stop:1348 length:237 start_codon:yes stop_codon:yes gene_type:complete